MIQYCMVALCRTDRGDYRVVGSDEGCLELVIGCYRMFRCGYRVFRCCHRVFRADDRLFRG